LTSRARHSEIFFLSDNLIGVSDVGHAGWVSNHSLSNVLRWLFEPNFKVQKRKGPGREINIGTPRNCSEPQPSRYSAASSFPDYLVHVQPCHATWPFRHFHSPIRRPRRPCFLATIIPDSCRFVDAVIGVSNIRHYRVQRLRISVAKKN
jgi:hypothetical protein